MSPWHVFRDIWWMLVAILVIGALAGFGVWYEQTKGPRPCSDFADVRREDVPARCFSDFVADGGGR